MSDKKKPEYALADIKELVRQGKFKFTGTATQSLHSLSFSITEASEDVLLELERKDFYKSTTEFHNHTVWQDVYKKKFREINLYIKLKIRRISEEDVLILSFKEDTDVERES